MHLASGISSSIGSCFLLLLLLFSTETFVVLTHVGMDYIVYALLFVCKNSISACLCKQHLSMFVCSQRKEPTASTLCDMQVFCILQLPSVVLHRQCG